MKDREIDEAFSRVGRPLRGVDPAVLDRITAAIHSSLKPVRPLPGRRALIAILVLMCTAVALAGAARFGFFGFQALGLPERVVILSALATLAGLTASELVSHWTPGSRHHLTPQAVVALGTVTLLSVFGLLFHDYHAQHFVSAGVVCLCVGVLHAIPVSGLAAWLLRRGFAVDLISAGAIAGTLGGIGGVTMLELHCPNLEAPHVLIWHGAVVPVSAAVAALVGWSIQAWKSRSRLAPFT